MKVKVGMEGFTIDSAHYTLSSPRDDQLHGHTYTVNVEVEGPLHEESGFVIDFNKLREIVKEAIALWDHKFIVPKRDMDKIQIRSPFRLEVKVIDSPFPTVEYIGTEVAKYISKTLGTEYKVTIKIYEGKDSYAVIEYP
ncbi:6-pyruvoyl tetrahydropterin synthase family protein [Metallosphaera tengchongensis]|uniref:6-pyruvoyl tetrahydropterin synthase family protein n=1 Tax=Metallosphaera tengchongensis TaxID=1532350 RepID=A0A6N0NWF2_9CREN|nr:6-pyruvoyl tetrahydropterin synthase family protein [Metallosphaera tengchongensis]QKR00535.1 6-pyruvoyl tetrahydropterin synthase family protein [Metallosphaera tengchongensis]